MDKPIIFSAPMVRALLDGRKTQTRRLAWREPKTPTSWRSSSWQRVRPGDRLWVRENHAFVGGGDPGMLLCAADWQETAKRHRCDNADVAPKWTPSIHMPRWASRLTLTVTATKIERLQDISERDAVAEGLENRGDHTWPLWTAGDGFKEHFEFPRAAFSELWCALHGPEAWNENPEVVALAFTVHQQNNDALPQVAS